MTSAAEAYDRHVGRYGSQLAGGLIEIAGVRPGTRVLDVGCGPGPLTAAVAGIVGAQHVAAIDASEPFAEACRRRVPGADVRVGTGEHLPFADGEFDIVLAQLVVQLMDDPVAGVREMVRVARPGGIVAAVVWDSTTMPLLRSFWDAALPVAPEVAGAIDEARRVGYPSADVLGHLWQTSGLHRGRDRRAPCPRGLRELRRPVRAVHDRHRPLRHVLRVAEERAAAAAPRGSSPAGRRAVRAVPPHRSGLVRPRTRAPREHHLGRGGLPLGPSGFLPMNPPPLRTTICA